MYIITNYLAYVFQIEENKQIATHQFINILLNSQTNLMTQSTRFAHLS